MHVHVQGLFVCLCHVYDCVHVKGWGTLGTKKKRKMHKEVWKMEAIFAFVLDDMLWKEEEIHLQRWAFVRYVDLNPWTDMYKCTDTQTHKAPWAVLPGWESLKLKSFQIYITWPLRNLFSSSQLFPESKKKKAACLILLKLIINLLHNAFEMVGLIRCEDQPTQ